MNNKDEQKTIIPLLRKHVAACNTRLKNIVGDMSIILLLRNCFPIDRPFFISVLKKEGLLTEDEIREFNIKNIRI